MTAEPRFDWRRISRGVFWMGIGLLLLLCTTGTVSWAVWIEALAYWPVLLIGLGLRMIFERSRLPALVLLSPLVILGTLGWVAASDPGWPEGATAPFEIARPAPAEAWSLEGDLVFARIAARTAPLPAQTLVRGHAAVGSGPALRRRGPDREPRVAFHRRHRGFSLLDAPARRERWELEIPRDLPLRLDLDLVFATGEFDASETHVELAHLAGVFNSLVVKLDALDAGDEDVAIQLRGAFNDFRLIVPDGTPVRARTDGLLARYTDHRHRVPDDDAPAYRVDLEGAFSLVSVRSP